jgi:hypothetical protein
MEKPVRPIPWVNGIVSTLIALLFLGVGVPNIPRAIVDRSFSPPRIWIDPEPWTMCAYLAFALFPVICIFILGRRWVVFNWIGWGMVALMVVSLVCDA